MRSLFSKLLLLLLLLGCSNHHLVVGVLAVVVVVEEQQLQQQLEQQQQNLPEVSELLSQIEELWQRTNQLENQHVLLEERQEQVNSLIQNANGIQLDHFLSRLQLAYQQEIVLRSSNTYNIIPMDDLKRRFNTQQVMEESETNLQTWILGIVEEELERYQKNNAYPHTTCPSATEIVQQIQVALTEFSQDGIGSIDHAQGGEIVHSMTSPTYESTTDSSSLLLGNVWWRKYIPQDWEKWLLPSGWQDWSVGLPSFVYHSLNIKGAPTAPPETILEKKTLPGACWPMDGNHGQVTIRLPYPVRIDSFTIDHVSSLIVNPTNGHETAPKTIRVTGYPPCDDNDDNDNDNDNGACKALGFQIQDPMEIAQIHYDTEGPSSIQTFDSIWTTQASKFSKTTTAVEDSSSDDDEDDDDDDDDEDSCSQAASCTAPPRMNVAGITVKILENWGNPEYTCMYRFRVHGEPAH